MFDDVQLNYEQVMINNFYLFNTKQQTSSSNYAHVYCLQPSARKNRALH